MVQERLSGPRTAGGSRSGRGRQRRELPAGGAPGLRAGRGRGRKCRGGAGPRPHHRPGPPRARPREPGKSGGRAGEAGSPDRRSAPSGRSSALHPCPEHRGRERACGRPPSRGPPGPACRSTCLPSALAPAGWHSSRRGRGGARSPRQRRAVDWECRAHPERAELGFPPGSAGSFCLPGPPRRASALLGAPAAWRRLGARFGLHDPAASPGWPFQTL